MRQPCMSSIVILIAMLLGRLSAAERAGAIPAREVDGEARILATLAQRMDVDFQASSLSDAADFFSTRLKVPVLLDGHALESVGVEPNTTFTLTLSGMQTQSVLNHMLAKFELEWTVIDEAIVVTTPDVVARRVFTRVYNLRDLVSATPDTGPEIRYQRAERLLGLIKSTVAVDTWEHVGGPGAGQLWGDEPLLVIEQSMRVHARVDDLLRQIRAATVKKE